jgi:hypothetical protein
LRDWHEKYEKGGLTIVGVHSPEFPWEKPLAKVKEATARLMITFPVVQDNDFDIWKRYGVRAWPTILLVDKKGRSATAISARARMRKPNRSSNSCLLKQVDRFFGKKPGSKFNVQGSMLEEQNDDKRK